ncbi:endoplasmic reticulum-based factor for assembly of V-ATPase-domain-containing protein [Emericellopsis atlantica]|uniref:Endoplasmic reticulum-based factor for assembly of V-ATPase-domain-containing protein n=1 Tax=Emericellopsis atlantica TaxID=2614577 RepID=A0A9P7ZF47_9HYPO|nr:endoplasmic reticulum-based factor for assembly of V-ATPase-domain-containing protein [Emericellopsis atlantica]KAG9250999.1 endoplasmic reticulum-based factor for assembly of V-ATPase-domain-containing protein [Emericellopsis atlantica]
MLPHHQIESMVLLTMTASIVEALERLPNPEAAPAPQKDTATGPDPETATATSHPTAPSLEKPAVGSPISHSQILDIYNALKKNSNGPSLESLLVGAKVYVPPPPPKPEPTPEYKALMARLRREAESQQYKNMTAPKPESFSDRFPHAYASVNAALPKDTGDDDEITYSDVHRQMLLLLNFLVSIMGVAGTLWVAARWWSLPARLFLTLGGAIVVAIAEVAVYQIYVWKMGDAKGRQDGAKEAREVIGTWTSGDDVKNAGDGGDVSREEAVAEGDASSPSRQGGAKLASGIQGEDSDGVRRRQAPKMGGQP